MTDFKRVKSDAIKVYPAVGRAEKYADSAYINTEKNITNLLKSIYATDECCFTLGNDNDNAFTDGFKFVINGYYFEITDASSLNKSNLWARIYINNGDTRQKLASTKEGYPSLDDGDFLGVQFYNSATKSTDVLTGYTAYDLQLTDESGNTASLSKFKKTVGSSSLPVYINAGTPTAVNTIDLGSNGSASLGNLINTTVSSSNSLYISAPDGLNASVTFAGVRGIRSTSDNSFKLETRDFTFSSPAVTSSGLIVSESHYTYSFAFIGEVSQFADGSISATKNNITIEYCSSESIPDKTSDTGYITRSYLSIE